MLKVLIRKLFAVYEYISRKCCSCFTKFKVKAAYSVSFGGNVQISSNVIIKATDGGEIRIGSNVSFGANSQIISQGGIIEISDNCFIGTGVIITSKKFINIGEGSQIAEYVVIRDQDHNIESRPIRTSGFKVSPIIIQNDVWLAAKSTVLRGCIIGEGAVIGAHSLVNKDIPEFTLAAGIPAKVIKKI